LSYRPRSAAELRVRLERKGFEPKAIKGALSFLKDKGFIDDSRFARAWIDYRMKTRPAARAFLRRELIAKGVDGALAHKAVAETAGDVDELKLAGELIAARLSRTGAAPGDIKAKKRMYDYLARRGFSFSLIKEALGGIF